MYFTGVTEGFGVVNHVFVLGMVFIYTNWDIINIFAVGEAQFLDAYEFSQLVNSSNFFPCISQFPNFDIVALYQAECYAALPFVHLLLDSTFLPISRLVTLFMHGF